MMGKVADAPICVVTILNDKTSQAAVVPLHISIFLSVYPTLIISKLRKVLCSPRHIESAGYILLLQKDVRFESILEDGIFMI